MFINHGLASVSEYLGDRIVYRNLTSIDASLPPLSALSAQAGLLPGQTPRKTDAAYARVIVRLLGLARAQDAPGAALKRVVFVGDTRMLDGSAFTHICQAGEWPGLAFIGSENDQPLAVETVPVAPDAHLYLSNRWAALADFDAHCASQGQPIDERTAVVIDLDKTALGARGRNAGPIDQARVQAVEQTVAALLGQAFNRPAFMAAYQQLNQPEFHPFTADNQDYLAYVCLVLGSGMYDLPDFIARVRAGELAGFRQFIDAVDKRAGDFPPALGGVHAEIYANVRAGDPTPFKPFRRNEYLATVNRMGCLPAGAPLEKLLEVEITLTQEVRVQALEWRQRGALLFGLSDKPDEASIPTAELAAQGRQPIHRTLTHAVGSQLASVVGRK